MYWPARLSPAQKLGVLVNSVRFMGPVATLKGAIARAVEDRPDRDTRFDQRYGTDTGGEVQPEELGIDDADTREAAVRYLPSPPAITRRLLGQVGVDPREWAFVDFGCGKGRVLMMAAEYGFRRVVGVEISRALSVVAQDNAKKFAAVRPSAAPIEVHRGDARAVELPSGDTVLHFYHPFGAAVLTDVIAHVGRSLERDPRRLRIVYLAAFQEALDVLEAAPFLRCTKFVRCVDNKYCWALYQNR
jgi:SAM-dependent methyltransferase